MKSRMKGKLEGWDNKGPHFFDYRYWLDHLSHDPGGPYYSEPYQASISLASWKAVREARAKGWEVIFTGQSVWNPGECLLITFTRKDSEA